MRKIIQVLLLCIMCVGLFGCSNGKDNTDLSSKEVQKLLEDDGFKFEKAGSEFIAMRKGNTDMYISKIQYYGSSAVMYFIDGSVATTEAANILKPKENTTDIQKKHYENYQNWLEEMGLSEKQIVDVLDYYNENN